MDDRRKQSGVGRGTLGVRCSTFGLLWRLGALVVICGPAIAQPAGPRIGYIYPAGGKQGDTLRIAVGGQRLSAVNGARFSAPGIRGTIVEYVRPMNEGQASALRQKLRDLEDRRFAATGIRPSYLVGPAATRPMTRPATRPNWTLGDDLAILEIRKKLSMGGSRSGTPAVADTVILNITITPDAPVGEHDLRLLTTTGMTNPMKFVISQLREYREADLRGGGEPGLRLPAIINGQIMPGEVDRFAFTARKGERIVAAVSARELIPYIADAVPGWFQAAISLYDTRGTELAFTDDYRFHADPILYYKIPQDGRYVLQIRDALYRGREDFVYRITLGEVPFITQVFPLGGRPGTSVELWGWNLPRLSLAPELSGSGVHMLSIKRQEMESNRVPFLVGELPECAERDPNNTAAVAQPVTLPVVVNGRIHPEGDWDVYRFEGRRGDRVVAEVHARRLNSPVDSVLRMTDAAGKQIAYNDDFQDKGDGLNTHHADSLIQTTLPADGTYYVHVGDIQNKGGVEYGYRLRISAPLNDYELRVAPSSVNIRAGQTLPLTVYAMRKDGFAGEIALTLGGAPGFSIGGARIPAGQDKVRVTLTAPSSSPQRPLPLTLDGRAEAAGQPIVRRAVPAEDMMQAFAYRHLVPAQQFEVLVSGRGGSAPLDVAGALPVKITAGGTGTLKLGRAPGGGELKLELNDPPEGITIQGVTAGADSTEVTLQSDGTKVKAGLGGNLIMDAYIETTPAATEENPNPQKQRRPLGILPAIPFDVIAPQAASSTAPTTRPGG